MLIRKELGDEEASTRAVPLDGKFLGSHLPQAHSRTMVAFSAPLALGPCSDLLSILSPWIVFINYIR